MSRPYVPLKSDDSSLKNKTFDIAVVIALAEEFKYFLSSLQCSDVYEPPQPKQFWDAGHCFWAFDLVYKEERKDPERSNVVQVVAYLVGEMGTEFTSVATSMLVTKWHVPFIVNIGVTGSLDKDLKVGSILFPTQITHYTANAKIRDGENGKDILIGTRAFATSRPVVSQFANFVTTTDYEQWQRCCMAGAEVPESVDLAEVPELLLGHLASGNVVIDSEEYKKELKATDRKLMACEMEAAGFMIAEQFLQASARAVSQFISLRCISDMAANKHTAESGANKIIVNGKVMQNREWAMRNVTILFMFLVDRRVINADINAQLDELCEITRQLQVRKKETALRPLQRSQTALQLIETITQKTQIEKLSIAQCTEICNHINPAFISTNKNVTQLRKNARELLEEKFPEKFASKRSAEKPPTDNRKTKVPRTAMHDDMSDSGAEASSTTSHSGIVFTTPARSTGSSSRDQDTQLEGEEGNMFTEEGPQATVPISALQQRIDELAAFIRENATADVPSGVFDSVSISLDDALAALMTSIEGN